MKGRALLFGLNYTGTDAELNGCINDVKNIANYLTHKFNIPCTTFTDDVDKTNTSGQGMVRQLYEMALRSYSESLDFVWIHYSGHGSQTLDTSNDEQDGRDECLVPNDYDKAGLLSDDYIHNLLTLFNPKTRVVCMFDSCHSGTVSDLKFSWEGRARMTYENPRSIVKCKAISISGCLDPQTSADAYNVSGDRKFTGAMTSCLLMVLNEDPTTIKNVFTLVDKLRAKLASMQFTQIPKLCSSFNLGVDPVLIPS